MIKPIHLMEVKQALRDHRFRESLPLEFKEDIQKYLQNPGCACNVPLYKKLLAEAKEQLVAYFPNRVIAEVQETKADDMWTVINCTVNDLEERLRKLPPGRKQMAMSRFEDQITVVIKDLEG